jgi:DNA-binding CsgD family transcriptional regulator
MSRAVSAPQPLPPPADDEDPRTRLTAAQLACLRLARTKVSNKNIARAMGISQHTVIQHLRTARMRLGDLTRAAAIELVDQWDRTHPHDVINRPRPVAPAPSAVMFGVPLADAGVPEEERENAVREDRVRFDPTMPHSPSLAGLVTHWLSRFSTKLTPAQRTRTILWVMLGLGFGVLVMVAVGESIQRTLHGIGY